MTFLEATFDDLLVELRRLIAGEMRNNISVVLDSCVRKYEPGLTDITLMQMHSVLETLWSNSCALVYPWHVLALSPLIQRDHFVKDARPYLMHHLVLRSLLLIASELDHATSNAEELKEKRTRTRSLLASIPNFGKSKVKDSWLNRTGVTLLESNWDLIASIYDVQNRGVARNTFKEVTSRILCKPTLSAYSSLQLPNEGLGL